MLINEDFFNGLELSDDELQNSIQDTENDDIEQDSDKFNSPDNYPYRFYIEDVNLPINNDRLDNTKRFVKIFKYYIQNSIFNDEVSDILICHDSYYDNKDDSSKMIIDIDGLHVLADNTYNDRTNVLSTYIKYHHEMTFCIGYNTQIDINTPKRVYSQFKKLYEYSCGALERAYGIKCNNTTIQYVSHESGNAFFRTDNITTRNIIDKEEKAFFDFYSICKIFIPDISKYECHKTFKYYDKDVYDILMYAGFLNKPNISKVKTRIDNENNVINVTLYDFIDTTKKKNYLKELYKRTQNANMDLHIEVSSNCNLVLAINDIEDLNIVREMFSHNIIAGFIYMYFQYNDKSMWKGKQYVDMTSLEFNSDKFRHIECIPKFPSEKPENPVWKLPYIKVQEQYMNKVKYYPYYGTPVYFHQP